MMHIRAHQPFSGCYHVITVFVLYVCFPKVHILKNASLIHTCKYTVPDSVSRVLYCITLFIYKGNAAYCKKICNLFTHGTLKSFYELVETCPCIPGRYDHVTPLLKSLSCLPVKDQLYYRQAIMAFKCMTGQAPEYLTSQFITREQVSERTTRSSQKLNIPLFRTASGQRIFYYRTVKLWNNLESFLKLSPSVKIFKRSLRSQLLDNFVNTS